MSTARNDPPVLFERGTGIATITLNRPQDGNRWTRDMLAAFEPAVEALHKDEDTHVVIVRGVKRVAHTRLAPGLREARWISDELRSRLEWSHDVDEAIAAHKEGRKPRFTGK
jgi:1,4-dihydroxy-2-naphthoyl-CoA synthase